MSSDVSSNATDVTSSHVPSNVSSDVTNLTTSTVSSTLSTNLSSDASNATTATNETFFGDVSFYFAKLYRMSVEC